MTRRTKEKRNTRLRKRRWRGTLYQEALRSIIDLLAIPQKGLDRALFVYTFFYTRCNRVALKLLSQLYTFENSANCSKMSLDSDSCRNS